DLLPACTNSQSLFEKVEQSNPSYELQFDHQPELYAARKPIQLGHKDGKPALSGPPGSLSQEFFGIAVSFKRSYAVGGKPPPVALLDHPARFYRCDRRAHCDKLESAQQGTGRAMLEILGCEIEFILHQREKRSVRQSTGIRLQYLAHRSKNFAGPEDPGFCRRHSARFQAARPDGMRWRESSLELSPEADGSRISIASPGVCSNEAPSADGLDRASPHVPVRW